MSISSSDDERELIAAHERLLVATAALARAESRAEVAVIVDGAVREALGFAQVVVLARGTRSRAAVEGHVVALGDLTGVLLVDDPDDRPLSLRTRLRLLRGFGDTAGAALNAIARLDASRAQARHDALTRLPNRAALIERISVAIARARRENGHLALLFVDLDGFKAINDEYGHSTGDATLRGVAARLAANVRPQDTVARFGGDEFVVLCESLDDDATASIVADRLSRALAAPIAAGEQAVAVGASVGVTLGDGTSTPGALLRAADVAMYRAKAARTSARSA